EKDFHGAAPFCLTIIGAATPETKDYSRRRGLLCFLLRDLDPAFWRNLSLPVPCVDAQGNMLRTIDLDHAAPGSVGWWVRTYIGVRDRPELWPMGRNHLLHRPPHMHFLDRHGPAIGMPGCFRQKRRYWQQARPRGEWLSLSK